MNDSGQVVGYSTIASGEYRAFSWTSKGGMIDLGTTIGGLDMLVAQGARQFEWRTGQQAPTEVMREAAARRLAAMHGERNGRPEERYAP